MNSTVLIEYGIYYQKRVVIAAKKIDKLSASGDVPLVCMCSCANMALKYNICKHTSWLLCAKEHDACTSCVSFLNEFIVNYFFVCATMFKRLYAYIQQQHIYKSVYVCVSFFSSSIYLPIQMLLCCKTSPFSRINSIPLAKRQMRKHRDTYTYCCCHLLI